ncbi:cytochrome P450 72A68-like isoform X2 [Abrus precatorius]|uniref:Cytochrome P450 72A68-like isoform X2 n=1 Tax=Abrus precatorius TaxID=3816 RepID=A0A8B8KBZ4_ABRPR|nr:cytochrome P450 72A68-like isoform X2 [Abrus precatorius]
MKPLVVPVVSSFIKFALNTQREMEVAGATTASTILILILAFAWGWKVLNWLWLRPKRLERLLREQGLQGNSYRLLVGDSKEFLKTRQESMSKPMSLSDDLVPRVFAFVYQSVNKYGKNSFIWLGPSPRVTITDPEVIKDVFNKINEFTKPTTSPLIRFLAPGLVSHEGEKWIKHRKIINPAFKLENLKNMLPLFIQCCNDLISKWEGMLSSDGSCETDVWPSLQNLSCDVISRTAFGSSYEEGRQIFQLLKEQVDLTMKVILRVYIPGWRYPDWQERAREEVMQVFGNQKPDFDGLSHLKIVTMILNEVLRLYPPVVGLARDVHKDTKLGNLTLPAGVQLSLPTILVQHDSELWGDDATEFNPERFSEGVSKATNGRVSFFPFGWGPRICIGQNFSQLEAKIALSMMLQNFSFELSPTYTHAPTTIITLQPRYGAHVILRKVEI